MKVNYLEYDTERTAGKLRVDVNIRLSDPCGNGHNDFAITGTVYEKRDGIWEMVGGGCCHDEILALFPEFRPFVDLHLCDAKGVPMYPEDNGFYFLEHKDKQGVVKEYLRITEQEYERIKATASDKLYLKYLLYDMGVVARWEKEAKAAISQLEALAGKTFKDNSRICRLAPLTPEEVALIEERMAQGYYLPETVEQRRIQALHDKRQKKINDLRESTDKKIRRLETELTVEVYVIECGLSTDNFIYYGHENRAVFNWHDSPYRENISPKEFEAFLAQVDYSKLPEGIEFKMGKQ